MLSLKFKGTVSRDFQQVMQICINYYTDPDPRSGNFSIQVQGKQTILILFTKIQGWEFALCSFAHLLFALSLICSSPFCSFALCSFAHLLIALLLKIAQFKEQL